MLHRIARTVACALLIVAGTADAQNPSLLHACSIDVMMGLEIEIDRTELGPREPSAKTYCYLVKLTWQTIGKEVKLPDGSSVAFDNAALRSVLGSKDQWTAAWLPHLRDTLYFSLPGGHAQNCGLTSEARELYAGWFARESGKGRWSKHQLAFLDRFYVTTGAAVSGVIEVEGKRTAPPPCSEEQRAKYKVVLQERIAALKPR